MSGPETTNGSASEPEFRVFRPQNPYAALGLAVNYLMTKPAFARLRFGEWSRVLVGQINRKHYLFVVDAAKHVVGFAGWAITTKDKAEAWVEGQANFSDAEGGSGDCLVFNAWSANSASVNRFLLQEARKVMQGKDTVYFKRHYNDGTTRPARLKVNEFVTQHLERQTPATGPSD